MTQQFTEDVLARYLLKSSTVTSGKRDDGRTSALSKDSPQVLEKISTSRRFNVGSFKTAGRLTRDMKIVHWCWSFTIDGALASDSKLES